MSQIDLPVTAGTPQATGTAAWWRRLLRDPMAVLALLVLAGICLAALFAPWLAPYDPYLNSRAIMQPPAWSDMGTTEYLLGTDAQGRDILSRVLYGTRLTLLIGLAGAGFGGGLGALLGLVAAFSPRLDGPIMRIADMMLSLPAILLGLAIVAAVGQSLGAIVLALAIASIPDCARIARGVGTSIMRQEFIEAGRALGLRNRTIVVRYLLRNALSSLLVYISMRFGQVILIGAALSFLGLGVRPPISELGMMAAQGRDVFLFAPHISVIPSLTIFVIVLAANVTGDALRDVLDPRMRSR